MFRHTHIIVIWEKIPASRNWYPKVNGIKERFKCEIEIETDISSDLHTNTQTVLHQENFKKKMERYFLM